MPSISATDSFFLSGFPSFPLLPKGFSDFRLRRRWERDHHAIAQKKLADCAEYALEHLVIGMLVNTLTIPPMRTKHFHSGCFVLSACAESGAGEYCA